MTTNKQTMQLASQIWPERNVGIFTCTYGKFYEIAEYDNSGSAVKILTPQYRTIKELLAHLRGYWAATIEARK